MFEAVASWSVGNLHEVLKRCNGDPQLALRVLKQFERSLTKEAYGPSHPRANKT